MFYNSFKVKQRKRLTQMNIALLERVSTRERNKSNRLPAKEKHFFYNSKNSIAATPAVKSEFNRDMHQIAVPNSNYFINVDRQMGMIVEPMQGCCELVEW
jgi:hypothetical protein